jgi:phage gpG-like protein
LADDALEGTRMKIVTGLRRADAMLAGLDIAHAIREALGEAARTIESSVTEALSQPPGGDHSVPWLQTGALRASIGHEVDGNMAVVGSSSNVAVDQELGTRTVPPRPFLASTAADSADSAVAIIAAVLAGRLAGR